MAALPGAAVVVSSGLAGLDPERYNPVVVLPERGELSSALEEAGVQTIARPLAVLRRGLMGPRGLAATAARFVADRRALGRLGADLVHANTSVVLGAQSLAIPCVVHVREIYEGVGPRPLWALLRRRLSRADALVCVSRAVAAQFDDAQVIYDGLARVPRPAPREEARRVLGLPLDRFVVAVIGRISDWKGQEVLAASHAYARLRQQRGKVRFTRTLAELKADR